MEREKPEFREIEKIEVSKKPYTELMAPQAVAFDPDSMSMDGCQSVMGAALWLVEKRRPSPGKYQGGGVMIQIEDGLTIID